MSPSSRGHVRVGCRLHGPGAQLGFDACVVESPSPLSLGFSPSASLRADRGGVGVLEGSGSLRWGPCGSKAPVH